MTTELPAPEELAHQLGSLQSRAHMLHGDASDRFIRAKLRALSIQIRQIGAMLSVTPGALARVIATELVDALVVVLQQLEEDARRPLRLGR